MATTDRRARVGLLILGAWALTGAAQAQAPLIDRVMLEVRVTGFETAEGMAGIAVWRGPQGFPEEIEHAVATTYTSITDGRTGASFDSLTPGVHAVTVFHDKNDNQKFDKNWIGMPKEAWGVSNNARPRLRAPRYDEARLELTAGYNLVEIQVE